MTLRKSAPSRYRPRVRKRFGQHFLTAPWVDKLVRAIDPEADQTFLEIGPGEGALTLPLAAIARHVIAVELDRDLAARLRDDAPANVRLVEADFLKVAASELEAALQGVPARVAGNLPYNVASPILFRLVELSPLLKLTDATVMLQREVADRLTAGPGSRDYGALTVLIGHRARIDRLFSLPPGAFRPPPKVQSTVVRLRFHEPDPAVGDPVLFETAVQAAFTRRRKTLANALRAMDVAPDIIADALARTAIDGNRRPETLAIAEWAGLADAFARVLSRRG